MPAADRSRWANSRAPDLDPWREQDACGVGFVARASGHRSVDIARLALQALARVAHRGAAATDRSGDGAGLLTQIPAPLFYREAPSRGLALASGQPFAVGSFFLPRDPDALGCAPAIIEEVLCREGLPVLGWRDVPVDLDVLGAGARASCPRSEEHTSELQSQSNLVCRLLLEKKNKLLVLLMRVGVICGTCVSDLCD